MNHSISINRVIAELKADATANPKWRNKVISQLETAEAMCHKLSSREMSKAEIESIDASAPANNAVCICKPGMPANINCAIHGL